MYVSKIRLYAIGGNVVILAYVTFWVPKSGLSNYK